MNADKELYYFGCLGQTGHYLFSPGGHSCYGGPKMFGHNGCALDGPYCPPEDWPAGKWLLTTRAHWTIISWWDRSVDGRGGSHSTFLFRGYDSLEEFWAAARAGFPEVFARQPAPQYGAGVFTPHKAADALMVDDLVRCVGIIALSGIPLSPKFKDGQFVNLTGYSSEQHQACVESCQSVMKKHRLEQWRATTSEGDAP